MISPRQDAPPPAMPPAYPGDRGPAVIAIYWSIGFVAMVVVGMRVWARQMARAFGWDDGMMVLGLVFQIAVSIVCTHQAFLGGFKHLGNIPPPEIPEVIKWNYIMQGVGITSFTPPKLAVGLLILRVIDRKSIGWRHYSIWALMVFVFLLNALATIFTYVQCNPTEALWDRRLMATAKCWNPNVQKNFSLFQASGNVFADVVLAVMPITVIAGLRMPMQRRVALCILLGLGLLAAVAGSVKATYLASLTERSDITWETYNLVVWSGAENFVVIVCGSVPPLKPFYDKYISDNRLFTFASAWSKSGSNASTSRDYLKRSSPSAMESGRGNYYSKNSIKVGTSVSVSSSYADKESL